MNILYNCNNYELAEIPHFYFKPVCNFNFSGKTFPVSQEVRCKWSYWISKLWESKAIDGQHTSVIPCWFFEYINTNWNKKKGKAGVFEVKNGNGGAIISVGLPCCTFLQTLLYSIITGSGGLSLPDNLEVTYLNRPKDKFLHWFL